MSAEDLGYFQRREAQELAAAERATCPKAKQAHLDLAGFYRLKMEGQMPPLHMVA